MPIGYGDGPRVSGTREIFISDRRANLVGEFLFGESLTTSRDNSSSLTAPDGAELLVGSPVPPVYGEHQVELGNGAYFNTNITTLAAFTILIPMTIGLVDPAASPVTEQFFLGSTLADSGRISLRGSTSSLIYNLNTPGVPNLTLTPTAPFAGFRVIALRSEGLASGSAYAIDEFMGGARKQVAKGVTAAARAAAAGSHVIGGAGVVAANSGFVLRSNFVAPLFYNAYLSDADLLSAYLAPAAILAEMGKVV
jgi:hypothetical protein